MIQSKPIVIVKTTGGSSVDGIIETAERLGYELVNMSQSRSGSGWFTNYTLTFKGKEGYDEVRRRFGETLREGKSRKGEASMIVWTLIILAFVFYIAGLASTIAGSLLLGLFLIIVGLICNVLPILLPILLVEK